MYNQIKNDNLNYLIDPTSLRSIDYLYYHLKMKAIEFLLQSVISKS